MKQYTSIIQNLSFSYLDNKQDKKPILIFLHGWRCDATIFKPIYTLLEKKYRMISIDFPGFGQSETPPLGYKVEDYTETLKIFITKLKLQNPTLIGHSFGGRIAIDYSSKYSDTIQLLILINSGGIKNTSLKVKILRNIAKIGKTFKGTKLRNVFYKYIVKESDAIHANNNPILEQTFRNIINEDLQDRAESITCPSLILWGKKDTETPLWHGEVWNKSILHSQLLIHQGDHMFFIKDPLWVINHIEKHFSQ